MAKAMTSIKTSESGALYTWSGAIGGAKAPGLPDRIPVLDLLRATALFGIIGPHIVPQYVAAPASRADFLAVAAEFVFARGTMLPMFALLFGIAFAIQMERRKQGAAFVLFFMRRMLALAIIGVLYFALIEDRPLLFRYAILGFPLILFRFASDRLLAGSAIVLILATVGLHSGQLNSGAWDERASAPSQVATRVATSVSPDRQAMTGPFRIVPASHDYTDHVLYRTRHLFVKMREPGVYAEYPQVFAMFLIGLLLARRRVLHEPQRHSELARRWTIWGLAIGIGGNLVAGVLLFALPHPISAVGRMAIATIDDVSSIVLMFGYIGGAMLLMERANWKRRLAPLSQLGRMTLTIYVLHSVVMTLLFLPYGLGLIGGISTAAGVLLSPLVYLLPLPMCLWWIRRHKFGPIEYAWRVMTSGASLRAADSGRG